MAPPEPTSSNTPDPELMLAIESATKRASVALLRGGEVLGVLGAEDGDHHAERLLPMIDELLAGPGIALAEIGSFAVSIGPGAFTSLRIGLATLKGLVFGRDLPVAAVSTLHVIAHAACALGRVEPGELCVPVLDARRGEFYAGGYRVGAAGMGPQLEVEDFVFDPGELAERLEGPVRLVGEGARLFGDEISAAAGRADVRIDAGDAVWPTAQSVATLGQAALEAGEKRSAAGLVPAYLRRAQAEEERLARQGG